MARTVNILPQGVFFAKIYLNLALHKLVLNIAAQARRSLKALPYVQQDKILIPTKCISRWKEGQLLPLLTLRSLIVCCIRSNHEITGAIGGTNRNKYEIAGDALLKSNN